MLGTKFSKNKKAQHGSVMLEVIAVLALMGVMGSMLFRQIYQRNQELHNIQMASEIRTVKEAFSAYIQAYRAVLLEKCTLDSENPVERLGTCAPDSEELGEAIGDYLPAGWFVDDGPEAYYTFSLWTYQQADSSAKQVIFGIVAPKETTLPTTGWNFKRAARVALLVGADGGVYDRAITESIAGSLGSWSLNTDDSMGLESPTYVAMTGLDVFTPEYELPEGKVNLPEDWNLATQKLGAWDYFSAGGEKEGCYSIEHDQYDAEKVGSDDIYKVSTTCQPLFYVDDESSKVFVNNDLEIGSGTTTNLTLTQEGVIKQKDGLTIDADGRIISKDTLATAIGDLKQKERYLLDPAHTSVMNDIYLTSRGGVRLSDILPNYILKEQGNVSCANYTTNYGNCGGAIVMPTCPTGYQKSLVVMPFLVSKDSTAVDQEATFPAQILHADRTDTVTFSTSNLEVENLQGDISGDVSGTIPEIGGAITDGRLSNGELTNGQFTGGTFTANNAVLSAVPAPNPMSVKISVVSNAWQIQSKYQSNISEGNQQPVVMQYQTYCVFEPTVYISQDACESAGFVWDTSSGKCIPGLGEADCKNAGFTWDSTNKRCQYIYNLTNINAISNDTKRVATCKAAGFTWNGTSCTEP